MQKFATGHRNNSARKEIAGAIAGGTLLSAAFLAGFAVPKANAANSPATNGPACTGCWILPAGDLSGNRFVEETEITTANVGSLKPAWTFTIPDNSPIEASPIEANGTVYITSAHDDVYAVNAKTGKLEWEFNPYPKQIIGFPRNRGVALLDGKVFIATIDGHLIALDANTGQKIWDKLEVKEPQNSFYTMQPVPYKDQLLLGVSNGDWGGVGNISAFDPQNGDRIWEWDTIPKPGEPGNDSWSGDSWKRGGAAIWAGVAIDPGTDTLYADLGNPQPDFLGELRKGANLYSDSMVALDISGKKPTLKWYHQFIAHDTDDWDPAMPPVLFTAKIDGKKRKLVAAGDKAGNFDVLDAATGTRLFRILVSFQHNQHSASNLPGSRISCLNTSRGEIGYNGGAFDPITNTFFVPSFNQCGKWKGHFNAINLDTGVFNWRHPFNLPANGGALILSDGTSSIVFTGELGGDFDAFDAKTGKVLWHYDTGASIIAPPATYVEDGKRYVAVAAGDPGFLKVPEMNKQKIGPAVLTAFSLE